MNRLVQRIVAVILIPLLGIDPAWAAAVTPAAYSARVYRSVIASEFLESALSPREVLATQIPPIIPRRFLSHAFWRITPPRDLFSRAWGRRFKNGVILQVSGFPVESLNDLLVNGSTSDPFSQQAVVIQQQILPRLKIWAARMERSPWRVRLLSRLLHHPQGTQQYWRNLVYSTRVGGQDVDLFFHVWAGGGKTRIHDHADRLAFVVPLGHGISATNFSINPEDAREPMPGHWVRLSPEPVDAVPAWQVESLLPGTHDIHEVPNTSSEDRIVTELYVGPRQPLITFVPVDRTPGLAVVNNVPNDEAFYPLGEVLLREATLLSPFDAAAAIQDIALGHPAYTSEGRALISAKHAEDYRRQRNAYVYRSPKGPLVLRPSPSSAVTTDRLALLELPDGRVISGRVASINTEEVVFEEPSYVPGDFIEDQGRVTVPLDPRPQWVRGIGDAILLEDYLETLPKELADRIRRAYFSPPDHPSDAAQQYLELHEQSLRQAARVRSLLQGTVFEAEARLVEQVLTAETTREVLNLVRQDAIVDRESEILRLIQNLPALAVSQEELASALEQLTATLRTTRTLRTFGQRYADGLVRPRLHQLPENDIDSALTTKWGTSVADSLVIGAGPSGLQAAGFGVAHGEKVIVLASRPLLHQWTRSLMAFVTWLRSDVDRTLGNWRAGPPKLESRFGVRYGHLAKPRLLGELARRFVQDLTGRPFTGRTPNSDKLIGPDALKATPATNEFYATQLLQAAFIRENGGFIQEEAIVVDYEFDFENNEWRVTTHDGHVYRTRRLTIAAGTVGDDAEHTRIPSEITDSWKGHYTVIRSADALQDPGTLRALSNSVQALQTATPPATQWTFPAALANTPEVESLIAHLGPDQQILIWGDGETAGKTAIYLTHLNPRIKVHLIVSEPLKSLPRTLDPVRGFPNAFRRDLATGHMKVSEMTREQKRGGFISPQTELDLHSRIADGRIKVHDLKGQKFDAQTVDVSQTWVDGRLVSRLTSKIDGTLLAEIDGPFFAATGYPSIDQRNNNPLLEIGRRRGYIPEGPLEPLEERGRLALGRPGGPPIYYVGPWFAYVAHDFVTGAMRSRAGHIVNDHARLAKIPKQEAALRIGKTSIALGGEENAVLTQILSIIHDRAFERLFGDPARPRLVYQPQPVPAEVNGATESPVFVDLDGDPIHKAYLDLALAGEENLEVIPHLSDYLRDPAAFLHSLRQNLTARPVKGWEALSEKLTALESLLQQHPDIDLSGLIAHPGLRRDVIYMDNAAYELLFDVRSATRLTHGVLQDGERLQKEPLIVQVLQLMLSLLKTEGRVSEDVLQKHWADIEPSLHDLLSAYRDWDSSKNPPKQGVSRWVFVRDVLHAFLAPGLGLGVGFLSSLIGIGGGPLIVPVLGTGFPITVEQAAATSNAVIFPIAVISAVAYQFVHPHTLDPFAALSLTAGSLTGAWIIGNRKLRDKVLKGLMVGVISLIGLKYLQLPVPWEWAPSFEGWALAMQGDWLLFHTGLGTLGFFVGSLAALLGIGGGVLLVPALMGIFGLSPQAAAATSLASIPVTAVTVAFKKRASVVWGLAHRLILFGVIGAALGFKAVPPLSNDALKQLLGGVILVSCTLFLSAPALRRYLSRRRVDPQGFEIHTPLFVTGLAVALTAGPFEGLLSATLAILLMTRILSHAGKTLFRFDDHPPNRWLEKAA